MIIVSEHKHLYVLAQVQMLVFDSYYHKKHYKDY